MVFLIDGVKETIDMPNQVNFRFRAI